MKSKDLTGSPFGEFLSGYSERGDVSLPFVFLGPSIPAGCQKLVSAVPMATRSRFLLTCFLLLRFLFVSSGSDDFRIVCGSTESNFIENRLFRADSGAGGVTLPSASALSFEDSNPPSELRSPYRTARIFEKPSSYHFEIKEKGTHIVRLHFFAVYLENYRSFLPFSAMNYDLSTFVFDVSAMGSPLLEDFSVQKGQQAVKEFLLPIDAEIFDLSFAPSKKDNSPNPFAFVNAIEVLSAPNNFIPDSVRYPTSRGFKQFDKMSEKSLEIVERVNVGGPNISAANDTQGRSWIPDDDFLLSDVSGQPFKFNGTIHHLPGPGLSSRETAPDGVYETARQMPNLNLQRQVFNITWIFGVPIKNRPYFIRLHFCDIVSKSPGDLIFNVFVNTLLAEHNLQPGNVTNRVLAAPFYRDFIADANADGTVIISVGVPDTASSPSKSNGILNGVEIMGVIDTKPRSKGTKRKLYIILIASIVGGSVCLSLLILTLLVFVKRRRQQGTPKKEKASTRSAFTQFRGIFSSGSGTSRDNVGGSTPNRHLCLQISFAELKQATNNFDEKSCIGIGGFGRVYKGVLRDGTKVAVKRATPGSSQGLTEFEAEIIILSKIQHRHLVSLVGYCEEESEMILIYEFVEKGPLRKHLYGPGCVCLSWEQRLEICISAARGLHYLHTGCPQAIIHRDVKSTNILLDEDNLAKVADFGLSKLGPTFSQTHVSTAVKGSFGYLDPEYFKTHRLTEKSDVFSFGVVLLEVLCARPAIDPDLSNETRSLAEWALIRQRNGLMEAIVDPRIKDQVKSNALRKFGETAARCLADHGVDRPTMADVLWNLEYVLRLQRMVIQREPHEDSIADASVIDMPNVQRGPSTNFRGVSDDGEQDSDEISSFSTRLVFSQLVTDEGR